MESDNENKSRMLKLDSVSLSEMVLFKQDVKLSDNADLHEMTVSWVQVCKQGKWSGHYSGTFEFTDEVFGQIIKNFKSTQNRALPVDFEHASEMPGYAGSIAQSGAPATGWVIELQNRSSAGLWALVAWLEPGLTYIREKRYRFISPAVAFDSYDRITGDYIGCEMTSIALTNRPFLDGMAAVTATDRRTAAMSDNKDQKTDAQTTKTLELSLKVVLGDEGKDSFDENLKTVAGIIEQNKQLSARVNDYEAAEKAATEREVNDMVGKLVALGAISASGVKEATELALTNRQTFNALFSAKLSSAEGKKSSSKSADATLETRSVATEQNPAKEPGASEPTTKLSRDESIAKISQRIATERNMFTSKKTPSSQAMLIAIDEYEKGARE